MQIPCVSTWVNGVPELIEHEREGLLVPPGDSASLTAAMARLIDEADLRNRLGRAARAKVVQVYDVDAKVRRSGPGRLQPGHDRSSTLRSWSHSLARVRHTGRVVRLRTIAQARTGVRVSSGTRLAPAHLPPNAHEGVPPAAPRGGGGEASSRPSRGSPCAACDIGRGGVPGGRPPSPAHAPGAPSLPHPSGSIGNGLSPGGLRSRRCRI
jgi:hypothetical protein